MNARKTLLAMASGFMVVPLSGVSLIQLDFDMSVTAAQQQVFVDAASYWNSVITGYDLIYDSVGNITPHQLVIDVSIPFIDGANGTLGQAGPTQVSYYDNNPFGAPTHALWYASFGEMMFDSADVDTMMTENIFYGVVLHEMGHVLGIGTLWQANNNVNGTSYQLYTASSGEYVGDHALEAWRTEFNQPAATFVPVELGGGPGTAEGHWNEVDGGAGNTGFVSNLTGLDLRDELMTGWASDAFFVSTLTLGALDDLGYMVDYSKAGIVTYPIPEPSVVLMAFVSMTLWMRRRRVKVS